MGPNLDFYVRDEPYFDRIDIIGSEQDKLDFGDKYHGKKFGEYEVFYVDDDDRGEIVRIVKSDSILRENIEEGVVKDMHTFLNDLRDSGVTNMFGAAPYLQKEFGIDQKSARQVLANWMQSFSENLEYKGRKFSKLSDEDKAKVFAKRDQVGVKESIKETLRFIKENNPDFTNEEIKAELEEIKELGKQLNEKLCKKGEAYRKRRMAAGEKSSAYLSGRAVKVCKGQMSGKKKKKANENTAPNRDGKAAPYGSGYKVLNIDEIAESLRDWFKKESWVRINTSGNIAGDCGTMKKGKATTRCLPKKKAQSLTKAERKATVAKKVRGSKKGKQFVSVDEAYSGFIRNPEDPDFEPFNPTGIVSEFREELRALFGKFKGDLKNPEFIKGVAQIMNNWKSLLRSQLNENFDIGDRVELKPDYEETPGEIFTITQTSSGGRYFIADEDGRGWYAFAYQLAMADDEYINEARIDYDFSKEEIIRVIKQLKRNASTEINMIKAFEKALGRELTDDEIRGFKLNEAK